MTIYPVSTKDQIANLLTKPLLETDFEKLKDHSMVKERDNVYTSLKGGVAKNEEIRSAGKHMAAKASRFRRTRQTR